MIFPNIDFEISKKMPVDSLVLEGLNIASMLTPNLKNMNDKKDQESFKTHIIMLQGLLSGMKDSELKELFFSIAPMKYKSTIKDIYSSVYENKNREAQILFSLDQINGLLKKYNLPLVSLKDYLPKEEIKNNADKTAPLNIEISDDYIVIEPLKNVLKEALELIGVPVPDRLDMIAQQFYNEIVAKNQPNNFTGKQVLPKIYIHEYIDHADAVNSAIIQAIQNYFANLKQKVETGMTITQLESNILNFLASKNVPVKQASNNMMYILGGILGFILLIVLIRRK